MNQKSLISSRELKHSLWVVIILTLIFAFNDGRDTFMWGYWFGNFFSVLILVAITILAHMIGAKLAANKLGQEAELEIVSARGIKFNILGARIDEKFNWNIFGFKIRYIPFGAIIGLLFTLMSYGTFYLTAVSTIVVNKIPRIGKGFSIYENKEALIYFWALVANLIMVVFFNSINVRMGVVINSYFVLWNLLPMPGLLGSKIFFNNKTLYVFFLVFVIFFLLFVTKINLILLIIFAAIIAFLIMMLWFFKKEYK